MSPLSALRTDVKHLVFFVCRKGTHRSVAANDLGQHCCEWLYYSNDDTKVRLEADTVEKLRK
eukprot:6768772-Karenia_brevis.AAC.1